MAYAPGALAQLCQQRGTSLTKTAAEVDLTTRHFRFTTNGHNRQLARRHLPKIAKHWKCSERQAARLLEGAGVKLGVRR